jgi:hypothetical protein
VHLHPHCPKRPLQAPSTEVTYEAATKTVAAPSRRITPQPVAQSSSGQLQAAWPVRLM